MRGRRSCALPGSLTLGPFIYGLQKRLWLGKKRPMDEDLIFHVAQRGESQGQLTQGEILARVMEGRLFREDLCWRAGMPEWLPLGTVLADHLPAVPAGMPPPLPPSLPGQPWGSTPLVAAPPPLSGTPGGWQPPVDVGASAGPSGALPLPAKPRAAVAGRLRQVGGWLPRWGWGLVAAGVVLLLLFFTMGQSGPEKWHQRALALRSGSPVQFTEASVTLLQQAAAQGYAPAQADLAHCLRMGQGTARDLKAAAALYQQAAEAGNAAGQTGYAICLLEGFGIMKDAKAARPWLEKAAAQEHPEAWIQLARLPLYFKTPINPDEEIRLLTLAEKTGNLRARALLGEAMAKFPSRLTEGELRKLRARAFLGDAMAKLPDSPPEDKQRGLDMIQEAAQAQDADGLYLLGVCQFEGLGVPKDPTSALASWEAAAAQSHIMAMMKLASSHAVETQAGRGDPALALHWCRQAAEAGSLRALSLIGDYYVMDEATWLKEAQGYYYDSDPDRDPARNPAYVPRDAAQAIPWYRRAAEYGHGEAERKLGHAYRHGHGAPKVDAMALEWYLLASSHDDGAGWCEYGLMLQEGIGTPAAADLAAKAFFEASERDDGEGAYHYSTCLRTGTGVPLDGPKALAQLQKASELAHLPAMHRLAESHRRGHGLPLDDNAAFDLQIHAANLGYAPSQLALGTMYAAGQGCPVDKEAALHWVRTAIGQGHAPAMTELGRAYMKGDYVPQDFAEMNRWLEKALQAGDTGALYYQALSHAEGHGTPVDKPKALALCEKAALAGHPRIAFYLAHIHEQGSLGPPDISKAVKWYKEASRLGEMEAQIWLGVATVKGQHGLDKDVEEGIRLLRLAIAGGHWSAYYELGLLLLGWSELPRTAENDADGFALLLKAAQGGHIDARHAVARAYEYGRGVAKDFAQARQWYRTAAENGNLPAIHDYGEDLVKGHLGPADIPAGITLLRQAAAQGYGKAWLLLGEMASAEVLPGGLDPAAFPALHTLAEAGELRALRLLGLFYTRGKNGLEKDNAKAAHWLEHSAAQEDPLCLFTLGTLYLEGEGLRQDKPKAFKLIRQAAVMGQPQAQILYAICLLREGAGPSDPTEAKIEALAWLFTVKEPANDEIYSKFLPIAVEGLSLAEIEKAESLAKIYRDRIAAFEGG